VRTRRAQVLLTSIVYFGVSSSSSSSSSSCGLFLDCCNVVYLFCLRMERYKLKIYTPKRYVLESLLSPTKSLHCYSNPPVLVAACCSSPATC